MIQLVLARKQTLPSLLGFEWVTLMHSCVKRCFQANTWLSSMTALVTMDSGDMTWMSEEEDKYLEGLLLFCFASPLSGFCEAHPTIWMQAFIFMIIFPLSFFS